MAGHYKLCYPQRVWEGCLPSIWGKIQRIPPFGKEPVLRPVGTMAATKRHITAVFGALFGAALLCAPAAHAQSKPSDPTTQRAIDLNTASGSGVLNLSPTLDGALLDLDTDSSTLSGPPARALLDLGGETCVAGDPLCNARGTTALGYSKAFRTGGLIGLDLELEPRAAVSFGDDEDSALVGAIVRIGDDLKSTKVDNNTWYIFAGADAEAMHYSPDSLRRFTAGDFALQDRVIVGDAQAGIGYRMGDADVSVGYYRREVSSFEKNDPAQDFSLSEDAAAISFTWRR